MKRFLPYIGPLIGITGVSLALYFHTLSVQERVPMFYVGPRATIVDSSVSAPSQLQILYKGRPIGNANVVAATVYLWNDGRMPVRADNILEPISVYLDQSCEILEARLLKVSRPVTKFLKGEVSESAKYSLPISFNIMERSDGAAIQIVYAGKSDAVISIKGTIEGAGSWRLLAKESPSTMTGRQKLRASTRVGLAIMGVALLGFVVGLTRVWPRKDEDPSVRKKRRSRGWGIMVASLLYLVLGTYSIYEAHKVYSPGVPISILVEN